MSTSQLVIPTAVPYAAEKGIHQILKTHCYNYLNGDVKLEQRVEGGAIADLLINNSGVVIECLSTPSSVTINDKLRTYGDRDVVFAVPNSMSKRIAQRVTRETVFWYVNLETGEIEVEKRQPRAEYLLGIFLEGAPFSVKARSGEHEKGAIELIGTTHLQKGGKIKILVKALSEVGWVKGAVIAQFLNESKDAVVLMRAKDVLSAEEIEKQADKEGKRMR